MKKTLLLIALGMFSLQANALTLTDNSVVYTTEIDTSENFNGTTEKGVAVTFDSSVGFLSGWDAKNSLTLTLNKGWTTEQHLIYATAQYTAADQEAGTPASVTPDSASSFGFIANADGTIVGQAQGNKWTTNTFVAANKITDTVTVTLEKDTKGTSMTDANGVSIYNKDTLRYSAGNTSNLYVNTGLVSTITLTEYGAAATEFYASNAAGTWTKTFAASEVAALTAATANDGQKHKVMSDSEHLGKGNIVVGGNSQLFLESYGNGGDLTVEDNIYIGQTSFNEGGYEGVAIRFGNNGSVKTTVSGNVYLVDSATLKSGGTKAIEISGAVTDVVDGVDTGSTLTVTGQGFTFSGNVNLTGLTLNNSAIFTGSVNVGTLTLANGVTMTTSEAITTSAVVTTGAAALTSDLTLVGTAEAPLTLTLGGTLDLNGNALELGNVTLGGSLLQSLLDGSATSVTLFTNVSMFNGETAFDAAVPGYTVFTNAAMQPGVGAYELAYAGGNITLTIVPEPATATLSLLALAGLAARRRRK